MTTTSPRFSILATRDSSRRWRVLEVEAGLYELRNVRTRLCLTIAGGVSTANNVKAVQYTCDGDPSRRWYLNDVTGDRVFQIRNVRTGKCLTIAGGTLANDNLEMVQYDCDQNSSRRWTILLEGRFNRPLYADGSTRLDVCAYLGSSCGRIAANGYCRIQGYQRARGFGHEHANPTRVLNSGQWCRVPSCAAFKYIDCLTREERPGPGRPWPQLID